MNEPLEPSPDAPDTPDIPESTLPRERHPSDRDRIALGATAGLVSAAAALGAAEAVASLSRTFQSPVLDVGDRVVDAVPNSVKTIAIDWFGTNDKIALLVCIGSILAVYAIVVGILAFGRLFRLALVGIALFGLIGAWASQTTRREAPFSAVVPSVSGAVVGVAVLAGLRIAANRRVATDTRSDAMSTATPQCHPSIAELVPNDRRRFLAAAGTATASHRSSR